MHREVGAFEAKTHLSQLLDAVEEGETITITRHGKPVAALVPARHKTGRKASRGSGRGDTFFMAADFDAPLDEFKEYQ
jgi:prevent-host-death family protein